MPIVEFIAGQTTAPGATLTTLVPCAGNSFQIRHAPVDSNIFLLWMISFNRGAGRTRLSSPLLVDNVNPINYIAPTRDPQFGIHFNQLQKLYSGDQLIYQLSGSAVAGDIATGGLNIYYESLSNDSASLIGPDELRDKCVGIKTVRCDITPGATGNYSGAQSIIATENLLKAGKRYAVLGWSPSVYDGITRIYGPFSSNFGVALPNMNPGGASCHNGFIEESKRTGLDLIPVFNSDDRFNTFIDVLGDEDVVGFTCELMLAELVD